MPIKVTYISVIVVGIFLVSGCIFFTVKQINEIRLAQKVDMFHTIIGHIQQQSILSLPDKKVQTQSAV